ncbi:hypothetical protein JCM10003_998 [Bacteroides pyogenes JCM 10003]|nr:hypothetical protein JCM10003_998 [Bacteroides pyogenes JCM 10003]
MWSRSHFHAEASKTKKIKNPKEDSKHAIKHSRLFVPFKIKIISLHQHRSAQLLFINLL